MWAYKRMKVEDKKSANREKWSALIPKYFNPLFTFLKYTLLIAVLILLASHEAANPRFGKASVEFYHDDFSEGIMEWISDAGLSNDSLNDNILVEDFYRQRNFMPAWTINFELNPDFYTLLNLVAEGYHYGLIPSNYYYEELQNLANELIAKDRENEKLLARLELEHTATHAAIRFMKHIACGMRDTDSSETYSVVVASLPLRLSRFIQEGRLRSGILSLQPDNPQYRRLQRALSRYLYYSLEDTLYLKKEVLLNNKEVLAFRLINQGFLDESFSQDTLALISAVRNFQKAHSLEVTGELNPGTLEELSLGTKSRFYRIALNLDRIRKDELQAENSILVNIPEFRLHYYDKEGKETSFNVIVGKTTSPTPQISSKLDKIITNPYWTVPRSITRNEILPRLKKDTAYLERNGFSVVDNRNNEVDMAEIDWQNVNASEFKYWFRQTKMNNALGVVKFLFPNEHSVYLHDTQSRKLFNKKVRAYSHGCIRVQNPQDLAQMLVDSYLAETSDIRKIIRDKERKTFNMNESVNVYIRYYSCTADEEGNITFYPDIYSQDELAIQTLFEGDRWN